MVKNSEVKKINDLTAEKFPGEFVEYYSYDTVDDSHIVHNNLYPTEFLNSLSFSGMPEHILRLKVGMPVMLLRNINPNEGLFNGVRLIVKALNRNVLQCEIMTGSNQGSTVYIPRINLLSESATLPFTLKRKQFPVCLCFSMTINKSQGQSIDHLGIFLPENVFTHGQLYVALSRATRKENIRFLGTNRESKNCDVFVKNVVYTEVLNKLP